jgi:hypothetical protein
MLVHSRGPAGMARHRALRLGLPFAVFWVPLMAATTVFGLGFMHLIARGTWGVDMNLLLQRVDPPGLPPVPRGPNTMHLWFLWLLLWMSLATALLARFVPVRVWQTPAMLLRKLAGAWWGPLVLAAPLVATDATCPGGLMFPSGAFIPPAAEWIHNGAFYVVGLALYAAREELFAAYVRRWAASAAAGFVTFILSGGLFERGMVLPFLLAYNITAWLWSFALIGLALKWMPSRSAALGYLADSSYWVYLVHFPLTIAFGSLLYLVDAPALVKMPLNIAATTLVCLATYHLLVRFTWVSVLLNGKRHERNAVSAAAYASR